jgi:hypothetical protein
MLIGENPYLKETRNVGCQDVILRKDYRLTTLKGGPTLTL